jgi:hypothetical protein
MENRKKILTTDYTYISHEENIQFNAPHNFIVHNKETNAPIEVIDFQCGPIKEVGVNGVTNEDLLHMVKTRLEYFQLSEYACEENELALYHINKAIEKLNKRTDKRKERGVEGTHVI